MGDYNYVPEHKTRTHVVLSMWWGIEEVMFEWRAAICMDWNRQRRVEVWGPCGVGRCSIRESKGRPVWLGTK